MNENEFLTLVRRRGKYRSAGEAMRAANAVFGTIKAWLSPPAAEMLRKLLPFDVFQLWQYSPAPFGTGHANPVPARRAAGVHFVLKIQQVGNYRSAGEAKRAVCSVLGAMASAIPVEPAKYMSQVFPPEILGVCPLRPGWQAAWQSHV